MKAPKTRRRGDALEAALLDAAWQELLDAGYDDLTYEGIAQRAQTSRAVVYRRWPTKPELARAALVHGAGQESGALPDTGSLRGDLLSLMRGANRRSRRVIILAGARLGRFFSETGSSLGDLRETMLGGRRGRLEEVLDRAVARGEIDPEKLTPRVRSLPGDLLRMEALMTLKPVPDATLEAILDEVFLPLVRPMKPASGRRK